MQNTLLFTENNLEKNDSVLLLTLLYTGGGLFAPLPPPPYATF